MGRGTPIPGYENYLAYQDGKIYSKKSNKFLKPVLHNNGYYGITLWKNGNGKQFSIHRIIAITFIPNPNNLPEVDHIDCDRSNNAVSNLRWISSEENLKRSFELKHQTFNEKPVKQLDLANNLIKEYRSIGEAFKQTNIRHISEVCSGCRKTAGGYKWEYIRKE